MMILNVFFVSVLIIVHHYENIEHNGKRIHFHQSHKVETYSGKYDILSYSFVHISFNSHNGMIYYHYKSSK